MTRFLVSFFSPLLAVAGLLCGPRAQAQVQAQARVQAEHLAVSLAVPEQQLVRGATLTAGLHFQLDKGWHIYWVNAGDSGEPPRVRWTLPAGVTAQPFEYPAPQRLPLGPLMDFGYEGAVTFPVPVRVAADAPLGPATLRADVDWLVCREVCLPGKATVALGRPVAAAGTKASVDPDAREIVDEGLRSLPRPLPPGAEARFTGDSAHYTLAVLVGQQIGSALFFPADPGVISDPAPQVAAPLARGVRLAMVRDESQSGGLATLHGVVVLPGGLAYTVAAVPGAIPPALAPSAREGGLPGALALAFAGGLILNLMPCVFPVLFIKGLSLLQSSREERGRMRAHAHVYTLGILISFWIVVALLLLLRTAGSGVGWGFQFQSPVFLALMALFLFFLSLSLAGQFEIGLSLTSAGGELAGKGGYAGSFFTGVLAMVVATPCTAPLMGVAIGYALAHGSLASFAVFTALGLGLACPYLLLAYNPGWTRLLPRPGAWMELLKQLTAVPIFATVIWLVWLFTQAAGVNALVGLLAGFLLLGLAGAVLGRWPARRGATAWAVAVCFLAAALPVYAVRAFGAPLGAPAASSAGNDWKPFTPQAVAMYRAQGKPVLVDFTAAWCLSCQVNERVVLDRADVQQRFRQSGVVLLRADWTRHDAAIGEALAALGRSGIPTYVLYPASPDAAPRMLPEVLTTGSVFAALNSLPVVKAAGS